MAYILEANGYGMNLKDIINCITKEIFLYQSLIDIKPTKFAVSIRDIAKMLKDMGMPMEVKNNITKWHFVTSRNYGIFKNSRAKEYEECVYALNKRYSCSVDKFLIQCPTTEEELIRIGNAYSNCLPTYRDRIIDNNAMIFSMYNLDANGNVIHEIPSITFEVTKDLDFVQIKTFFDVDVVDPKVISILKTWKRQSLRKENK
jgi:hypothetical protein